MLTQKICQAYLTSKYSSVLALFDETAKPLRSRHHFRNTGSFTTQSANHGEENSVLTFHIVNKDSEIVFYAQIRFNIGFSVSYIKTKIASLLLLEFQKQMNVIPCGSFAKHLTRNPVYFKTQTRSRSVQYTITCFLLGKETRKRN